MKKSELYKLIEECINEILSEKNTFAILESRKQTKEYVKQGKLSLEDFKMIEDADPTPTNKWMHWMAKQWIGGNVPNKDILRSIMEEFYSFWERKKTKESDIYKYNTFDDIVKETNKLNNQGAHYTNKSLLSDYETIVDDENLLVMVPHTHEASRSLGLTHFKYTDCGDSNWCTTYKAPNHFVDYYYNKNVTLYYIKVKSSKLIDKLESNGYGPEFVVTAVAILGDEDADSLSQRGENRKMEAYDANDKRIIPDSKLKKYLKLIELK
jgi:hypothetical protein